MFSMRRTVTASALAAAAALTSASSAPAQSFQLSPAPLPFQSQLDPQMADVLKVLQSETGTPFFQLQPVDARQQFAAEDAAKTLARNTGKQLASEPIAKIQNMYIPGPGGPLPIRIYTPSSTGNLPVIVYYHGGGFVLATIDTYDASARALANLTGAIVVAVEYRKAPEYKFPAALQDAVYSYQWVLKNAASLGGDAAEVAVVGESAGGNLAAEVCLYARDNHLQMPKHQVLVYPVVDGSVNNPTEVQYQTAIPLGLPALKWFYGYYIPAGVDMHNIMISPLYADLHGLPPATVISAEIDPLQQEGRDYANKLRSSGVPVDYTLYSGVTHEFFGMGAVVNKARQAEQQAATDLKASFGK